MNNRRDSQNNQNTCKLSVIMMAYNQGEFIEEAITSVLKQDLTFTWELLIGDDCSSDDTPDKVKPFLEKYPNNIKYIRHTSNLGLHKNYVSLIKFSEGEFIAFLEADDYWIDSLKCKLQIHQMELNPDILWNFTNGVIISSKGEVQKHISKRYPEKMSFEEYLKASFNPLSNTIMIRNTCEPKEYPDTFYKVRQWDTFLCYMRLLNSGNVGYLPIDGLAWRRHENATSLSESFSSENRYKDWILINGEMKEMVPAYLEKYFTDNSPAYTYLSLYYRKKGNYLLSIRYLFKSLVEKPFRPIQEYRDLVWKFRNKTIS